MYSTDTELAEKLGKEADALNRHIAKEEMRSENAAQEAERKAQESQDNAVTDALARANALVEKYPFLNPGTAATNQDAIVVPMYWMGNLVCTNRSRQGVLIDAS